MCGPTQHVEKPSGGGGTERPPTPADDIQPPQGDQAEQGQDENVGNPSRKAKCQRNLLKDYFNNLGALAGEKIEFQKTEGRSLYHQDITSSDHHIWDKPDTCLWRCSTGANPVTDPTTLGLVAKVAWS